MTTMVLADVSVDVETAKAKVEQYRATVRQERSREDAAILHAFSVAAKGKQIIALSETIKAGGLDDLGRPRLAVCRATATRCELYIATDRMMFMDDRRTINAWRMTAMVGAQHVAIDWPGREFVQRRTWTAIVPIVPPGLRPPKRRRAGARDPLTYCHILWEAEWSNIAPRDPALIRQIGGDLWEVLATWDLTELERAVISGTRRA